MFHVNWETCRQMIREKGQHQTNRVIYYYSNSWLISNVIDEAWVTVPEHVISSVNGGTHPAVALVHYTLRLFPENWEETACVVPLNLRHAETCRLKLGTGQWKEKGGRDRELDYGEVSEVNSFFFPLFTVCWVTTSVTFPPFFNLEV